MKGVDQEFLNAALFKEDPPNGAAPQALTRPSDSESPDSRGGELGGPDYPFFDLRFVGGLVVRFCLDPRQLFKDLSTYAVRDEFELLELLDATIDRLMRFLRP